MIWWWAAISATDRNSVTSLTIGRASFWYSALMLLLVAAPWLFAEYWLAQLTLILIYSVAGLGFGFRRRLSGQGSGITSGASSPGREPTGTSTVSV